MTIPSANIVGMHFRPPAKLIMQYLAAGTPLLLQPEPENPYDSNACKVLLAPEHLPTDPDFIDNLVAFGHDIEDLRSGGPIHLAYIERSRAPEFLALRAAALAFNYKGLPQTAPIQSETHL